MEYLFQTVESMQSVSQKVVYPHGILEKGLSLKKSQKLSWVALGYVVGPRRIDGRGHFLHVFTFCFLQYYVWDSFFVGGGFRWGGWG